MRSWIASAMLNTARSFGRLLGCQLVVETSQHSLETKMELPNKEQRAWDENLYKKGQMYYSGYANPIKPAVDYDQDLENPDKITAEESEQEKTEGHVELISSSRYREYMRQDLISQLLTPQEKWRLIAYAVGGVAVLQFVSIIITLWATGSFV